LQKTISGLNLAEMAEQQQVLVGNEKLDTHGRELVEDILPES
jgi:hypothetical protein